MNNLKKKKVLILFFTLAIFCTSVVFANTDTDGSRWEKENGNWYYFDANLGDYVKGDWRKINNIWYYFESNSGVMLSDVIADISGQKYCFDESGAMNTGWKQSNDNWYYFTTDGSMVRNDWQYINGAWYFFEHSTGEMLSGVHREINGAK